jgi:ribosomal protein L11 methyltransferase
MPWQRVDLVIEGARAEALAEALEEAGALSTELTDADAGTSDEKAVFGEPGADAGLWPRTCVSALFNAGYDVTRALGAACDAAGIAPVTDASIRVIEDADWVALTQRQFEPIRVGERLWIVPTWYQPPDPRAINIILDPGAAFGTGSHPTTRLCLSWLERTVTAGDTVLDYGCGSGILAIAALKLGAGSAVAVDIDPLAVQAARFNANQNRVTLTALDAGESIPGTTRITVANILANPLRVLAPVIAAHTQSGGPMALSGILEAQADSVIAAYAPWAHLEVAENDGGWVLLAGHRI